MIVITFKKGAYMKLTINGSESTDCDERLIKFNEENIDFLQDISKPLSEEFSFNFFEYHKFFDDHTFFYLSTNREWHKYYLKKYARSLLVKNHIKRVFCENTKHYVLIPSTTNGQKKEADIFIEDMSGFNIYNCLYMYIHYKDSLEVFGFSTHIPHCSFVNKYFNNLDILYRFIAYFSDKARNIINISNNTESSFEKGFLLQHQRTLTRQEKEVEKFLENIEITRYPIFVGERIFYLTSRQIQCVYYLSKGRKYKEIAKLLGIGAKAVESHLTTVKTKVGCINNACLIEAFENNRVLNNMTLLYEVKK